MVPRVIAAARVPMLDPNAADGMQNSQQYLYDSAGKYNYFTGSTPSAINPAQCAALKTRGVTISVLYIPYLPLPANDLNPSDLWGNEVGVTNAAIPSLSPALQSCASPNFFYTASSPAEITAALQNMFNQANVFTRLAQ